ncbi:MAG: prolyl oligopeptidase family serine peptidase [Gemmatimonadota bacterium]
MLRLFFYAFALSFAAACRPSPLPPPPLARAEPAAVGDPRPWPDPYRALEDMASASTLEWAHAQDAFTRAWVERTAERTQILTNIVAASRHTIPLTPVERGGKRFWLSSDPTFTELDLRVTDGDGRERLLVSGAALTQQGRALARGLWPDPSGERLAVSEGRSGARWGSLVIRSSADGAAAADTLPGLYGGRSSVIWAPDGQSLLYVRFDDPVGGDSLRAPVTGARVMFHQLGSDPSTDVTVFTPADASDALALQGSDVGDEVAMTVRDSSSGTHAVLVAQWRGEATRFREVVPSGQAFFQVVGLDAHRLLLHTTLAAPNGRVVLLDPRDAAPVLVEVIPEGPDPIDVWTPSSVAWVGARILVLYRVGGLPTVRSFAEDGGDVRDVPLPAGAIWSGLVGHRGSPEAFLSVSDFTDPGTVFRVDTETHAVDAYRRPALPYDPSEFVTERLFWSGPAGDSLPMFIAHHRSVEPGPAHPVMLYGYGFGAWAVAPWFRPHMAEWMRRGGVFALPALRGGGEFGEAWHRAGIRRNRQAAIDDYRAAAAWLLERGLVRPQWLVAETNSAGASLVATALLQEPTRFGAAILGFPLLDLLNYEGVTGAAAWRSELGSVADPGDLTVLRRLSPVHTVDPSSCPPPLFVAPGSEDQTTPPFHAYKFVAAVQGAGCRGPALLRVAWGAGHAYGTDGEDAAENFADQLAFLIQVLPGWTGRRVEGAAKP